LLAAATIGAATGCTVTEYQPEDANLPDVGMPDAATLPDAPASPDAFRPDTGPMSCGTMDLRSDLGTAVVMGTTLGSTDRRMPHCAPTGSSAPDAWFTWTAPESATYIFDTDGSDFDTVLEVMGSCAGASLVCNDDDDFIYPQSRVTIGLSAGEDVVIVVDGAGANGHYVLNIHGQMSEVCNDMVDNDGDFDVDCEDTDCRSDPACTETGPECSDRIDNDNDFETDCQDFDCRSDPACDESTHCSDHIDNDDDFDTDCLDSDCSSQAICLETGANCADGIDNDVDGHIDCADTDCASITSCNEAMNCGDRIDNDGDDLVDCADSNCASNALCTTTETNCNNGLDDDADGLVDCSDPNCSAHCAENTQALCMNTMDDDTDGLTDCADLQCSCSAACPPAVAPSTTCPDMDLGMMVGDGIYHGTLAGYACGARADASCGTTHGAGAEIELGWTAPANGTYVFDTEDSAHAGGVFDTILTLRTQCAGGAAAEFSCDDDGGSGHLSRVSHYLVAGESIVVVIDAQQVWDGGNVTLNVHQR
jgi:hypothetical protein